MSYSELVHDRYSVRQFSDRPVTRETLADLLEDARVAPTATNAWPVRFLVLDSNEGMEKLAQCTKYTFSAPAAVIVLAVPSEAWVRPFDQDNAAVVDAAIVGTHFMLAVHDRGLGTTWVGYFDPAKLREVFAIPDTMVPVAVFPVGYPADDAHPSPRHAQRKELRDITFWETFEKA